MDLNLFDPKKNDERNGTKQQNIFPPIPRISFNSSYLFLQANVTTTNDNARHIKLYIFEKYKIYCITQFFQTSFDFYIPRILYIILYLFLRLVMKIIFFLFYVFIIIIFLLVRHHIRA